MRRETVATRTGSVLLVLLFLGTSHVALHTAAHPGSADAVFSDAYRLEGEAYDSTPASCDPDPSGQHTTVGTRGPATVAVLPRDGCTIFYDAVNFPVDLAPSGFWLGVAYGSPVEVDVRVVADGTLVGRAVVTVDPDAQPDEVLPFAFSYSEPVAAGVRALYVTYRVVSGPADADLELDALDWVTVCNAAPRISALTTNGLDGSSFGWADLPYALDVAVTDADGDPVTVTWSFADGGTANGTAVSRSFSSVGTARFTITATDDPTPRCPAEEARSTTSEAWFEVLPDWLAALDLVPGISCHDGERMASWSSNDTIAGGCPFSGAVDASGAERFLERTWLERDGTEMLSTTQTSFSTTYDSATVPDGTHTMRACTEAIGDVHGRVFCSPDYVYLDTDCVNHPPELFGLLGDGMGTRGTMGWADVSYDLSADVSDPDGDPVAVDWTWEDGVTGSGQPFSRSFAAPGTYNASVVLTDDVSARCPELFDMSASGAAGAFRVLDNVTVVLDDLVTGVSCNDDSVVPSWRDEDIIAGGCTVRASVIGDGEEVDLMDRLDIQVDGATVASGNRTTELSAYYDATSVVDGAHVLEACAWSSQDVQKRVFCSPSYAFTDVDCTNHAPVFSAIDANGLIDGFSGWVGHAYSFSVVDLVDPDGDPYTVDWAWDDGLMRSGQTVERGLAAPGSVGGTVRIVDDLSARCPLLLPLEVNTTVPLFSTVSDLSTTLRDLAPGKSCDDGVIGASWRVEDVIAVGCTVAASVDMTGVPTGLFDRLRLRVDGVETAASASPAASFAYQSVDVADGARSLDVCATAQRDIHGRSFCSGPYAYVDVDCTNVKPSLSGFGSDAMEDGRIGWTQHDYRFDATGVVDPDGDPVSVEWLWSDGVVLSGASASRVFSAPGTYTSTLRLVDDPSLRCPYLPVRTVSMPGPTFEAIADMVPDILALDPGTSCDVGTLVPSWQSTDVVAIECPVDATVTVPDSPLDLVGTIDLRVDGVPFATSVGSAYVLGKFRTADHGVGTHTMTSCLTAEGDVHGRLLCSAPYTFDAIDCTNIPPLVGDVVTDAMPGGHVWSDHPYTFRVGVVQDPEGDPYAVTWRWSDGLEQTGPVATRSFATTGLYSVTATAVDDPDARCPGGPPKSNPVRSAQVTAVQDWSATMIFPGAGRSCIAGVGQATTTRPVVMGPCEMRAQVTLGSSAVAPLVRGVFALDGRTLHHGTASDLRFTYNSFEHPHEEMTLTGCFKAAGDVHGRTFCADPYRFLNVGGP